MYVDKQMSGANLMQSIARVNRVYGDKPGGLIVDYIGIAADLKEALSTYTESGGKGNIVEDQESEIVPVFVAKLEILRGILATAYYERYQKADAAEKLKIILQVEDFLLDDVERKERYLREVAAMSRLFALAMPQADAVEARDEVAFYQAVRSRLVKLSTDGGGRDVEIETTIRQIVDKAVVSEGVIDIFDAAGIKKPDISILSDEFLAEIEGMEHRNIAAELLRRILRDEIKAVSSRNAVQGKKFSEMLQGAINRYQSNLITAAEVIEELIAMAKEVREEHARAKELGLSDDEIAFYDALAENDSAKDVLGDETLRDLARVLVGRVRENATIDWNIRESARASMRVMIKRDPEEARQEETRRIQEKEFDVGKINRGPLKPFGPGIW